MKTLKKVWKGIAGKLKNWKGTKEAAMEEPRTPADVKDVEEQTETDIKLYEDININSEDLQSILENGEKARYYPTETTIEPTSVDREINEQSPSSTACFDSKENSADEKSSKRAIQPIVAGVVGAVLLVSCVASYLLIESSKVHVIAVIGGIVGLVCMGFALYHAFKPNTKLDKVQNVEQLDPQNLKASGMLEKPQTSR